jgi:putative IMPACT (imprinted ancient) family translation regulator
MNGEQWCLRRSLSRAYGGARARALAYRSSFRQRERERYRWTMRLQITGKVEVILEYFDTSDNHFLNHIWLLVRLITSMWSKQQEERNVVVWSTRLGAI